MATAQAYPSRPITMIVPFAPGGLNDAVGRLMAERMGSSLGQPVIIETISGADGRIGAARSARAKPDGYTIDLGFLGNHVLNGALYSLPYDVLNDFTPIAAVVTSPDVRFARKNMVGKDLNELIAWLKANPAKASVGVASSGARIVTAFFRRQTGTEFTLVPYRGAQCRT
jgi:tripartite-type tricarboxylate transporter receptor subunit TctC